MKADLSNWEFYYEAGNIKLWFEHFEAELREKLEYHWKQIHSTKNPLMSEHFGRYKAYLEILGE